MATNKDLILPELSYKVVGILYGVHNELGRYAREKQYGDALEVLFKEQNIPYKREIPFSSSGNRADFIIDDKILLEMKTTPTFTREHYRQIHNYLHQTGLKLGILVNFREVYLKPKRVIRSHS